MTCEIRKRSSCITNPFLMVHMCTLARFRPEEFAVAIDTGPIPVDKGHRIAADGTIRRWPLVESWKDGQLDIVFIHKSRRGCLPLGLTRAHFQLQGFFGTFPAGYPDEGQPSVDDGSRHCPDGMTIGEFLAVRGRNVHFTIGKTVLYAQLLPKAFRRRTSAATRGNQQRDIRHRISDSGKDESVNSMRVDLNTAGKGGARSGDAIVLRYCAATVFAREAVSVRD